MKKVLFTAVLSLAYFIGYNQCTPNPTGNPGVTPPPDSISCMERGVFYEQILQVENYDSFSIQGFSIKINFARIDSIKNFPCGISWEADQSDNTYDIGESGCIRVFGTTTDAAGQYPLEIYMTMSINVPFIGDQEASGEINGLIQQLVDLAAQFGAAIPFPLPQLKYFTRVIEQGNACPAIDSTATLRGSGATCPPFSVSIDGGSVLCSGGQVTLDAIPANNAGAVVYTWSPGSIPGQSISVQTPGTFSVTADDGSTTATASIVVTQAPVPTANFTSSSAGNGNFSFTSTSTGATSYAWNFGDPGSGVSNTAITATAAHTFTANNTYSVRLIATNACGADTSTQSVTSVGVYISAIKTDNVSMSLYPNPNTGAFEIDLVSKEQAGDYTLRIFDLQGKTVYNETLTISGNKVHKSLQLDYLNSGIYTVNLNSISTSYIQKLVIY